MFQTMFRASVMCRCLAIGLVAVLLVVSSRAELCDTYDDALACVICESRFPLVARHQCCVDGDVYLRCLRCIDGGAPCDGNVRQQPAVAVHGGAAYADPPLDTATSYINEILKRSRYFLGKRVSEIADNDDGRAMKRTKYFLGKRAAFDGRQAAVKRQKYFLGKRSADNEKKTS